MPTNTRRKSSHNASQSSCLEARVHCDQMQVRDSKLGDNSPIFNLVTADFTSLLRAADYS
ncbi:DUF397 domain-containing protein [Natronoglycomyces albus]|uniref:DUF397 domain-containing protein n=1 Tax=Natronoglycomyces albus TaxID=2811108 RepID=A0A895XWP2_9ACTN|nr:DUF397 domain-containing protein [Natronoglycomyces albus]QSB06640.1 DUF397 domain-containing protein [Natronoglycomyces albus]